MKDVSFTVDHATAVGILGYLKRDYLQRINQPGASYREKTLRRVQDAVDAAESIPVQVSLISEATHEMAKRG